MAESHPFPSRLRRRALIAALAAAIASAAAAAAPLWRSDCGGCVHSPPLVRALAIGTAAAWLAVAATLGATRCAAKRASIDRWLPAAAFLLTGFHAAVFFESPATACIFCIVALGCGAAATGLLLRGAEVSSKPAVLATGFAGLVAGTILAPTLLAAPVAAAAEARGPSASVVSIVSPGCPVCRRFVRDVVPALRERLGDTYELLWIFDENDPAQVNVVRAALGGADDSVLRRHLSRAADAASRFREGPYLEVPLTIVGADTDRPRRLGDVGAAQILSSHGRVIEEAGR